ncbi:NADPH-dependent ferric siderophore reductase [Thermocatellispora tengchongensis]|uniref:NADPH-dependent ferric siderophore reductase n=1 Tax=Thermocatellispora tengchongensis TaxID=1073253 RepID=A0A840P5C0_9ACTN|nr:siderophore-interacting protein [Thermocatellispora tengchongensis]MBB5134542.1 NADPH-dependent ferric siderophore reductase [Thermocatellispora tengchongensis]
MPRFPALVARAFESRGVPCTVEKIEDLSPSFRRLHLRGEGLRGHVWTPCQVTSFRVTPTEFRHYTPDAFDAEQGTMSILFYRHHTGAEAGLPPGEAWLSRLETGDRVIPSLPACARGFRPAADAGGYLVFGDGTTVGLWHSLIQWTGVPVTGAVEVPEGEREPAGELLPGLEVLPERERPGEALLAWVEAGGAEAAGLGGERAGAYRAYLSGHGQTIQRLRTLLRERHGLSRAAVSTQPYWATGKAGL